MKIEFDLPDEYKNEKLVVCRINEPSPILYCNVFEEGDVWVKIKGCEECPTESRKKCCKNCSKYRDNGCEHHLDGSNGQEKPFVCVFGPTLKARIPYCQILFECLNDKNKGKIKKVARDIKSK